MGIQFADITINNTNTIGCHAPNQPESIIYYLAGGNQDSPTKSKASNQQNSQNNNSGNNNSSQNNNSGNNSGNIMSGSDGGNNGGNGNGNGRNNKNNRDSNQDDKDEDDKDEDDEEEDDEEKDDEEEENDNEDNDNDQKDKQSNKSRILNHMAKPFVPHTHKLHNIRSLPTINEVMSLHTINEDEFLVAYPSVLIQSTATVPMFIDERKEETNVKSSNVDQYVDDRPQNKKKKGNAKKKKKRKLQKMYSRINNQPYFDIIETAKRNVYISQKLIRNIQTKTATSMDNIRNYMNSLFEIHHQGKCGSKLELLEFGFIDKETNQPLYCSLTCTPERHSDDQYKLNDSLQLSKTLMPSTYKFESIDSEYTNKIINVMKKLNTENILKNCDWNKIAIVLKKENQHRISASVTKEQLAIREKQFNGNEINLIPIIGFNKKQVNFAWIIKIDTHIHIALSLAFKQQNNAIIDITINGIYIDKQDLLMRHYLAYPPHMNECKCLNQFESIINDIHIGNPDLWFNKIKQYETRRKNVMTSNWENESDNSSIDIKTNLSAFTPTTSLSSFTPSSSYNYMPPFPSPMPIMEKNEEESTQKIQSLENELQLKEGELMNKDNLIRELNKKLKDLSDEKQIEINKLKKYKNMRLNNLSKIWQDMCEIQKHEIEQLKQNMQDMCEMQKHEIEQINNEKQHTIDELMQQLNDMHKRYKNNSEVGETKIDNASLSIETNETSGNPFSLMFADQLQFALNESNFNIYLSETTPLDQQIVLDIQQILDEEIYYDAEHCRITNTDTNHKEQTKKMVDIIYDDNLFEYTTSDSYYDIESSQILFELKTLINNAKANMTIMDAQYANLFNLLYGKQNGAITCGDWASANNGNKSPQNNSADHTSQHGNNFDKNKKPNKRNNKDNDDNNDHDDDDEKYVGNKLKPQFVQCNHLNECEFCSNILCGKSEAMKMFKALIQTLQRQHEYHMAFEHMIARAQLNKKSKAKLKKNKNQIHAMLTNQARYDPPKRNIAVSRTLTEKIIPSTSKYSLSNPFKYLLQTIAMQCHDGEINLEDDVKRSNDNLEIINVDLQDKQSNNLFCIAKKNNNKWEIYDQLYTKQCISNVAFPESSRNKLKHKNGIILNLLNAKKIDKLVDYCKWKEVPVYNCHKQKDYNRQRTTLSITKEKLNPIIKRTLKNMNINDKLIPIVMFDSNSHWIEHIFVVHIKDNNLNNLNISVGISLKQIQNKRLKITGLHLNKQMILQQHELAVSHNCNCLAQFGTTINDIYVGNPNNLLDKVKNYKQKYEDLKQLVERFRHEQLPEKISALQQQAHIFIKNDNGKLSESLFPRNSLESSTNVSSPDSMLKFPSTSIISTSSPDNISGGYSFSPESSKSISVDFNQLNLTPLQSLRNVNNNNIT